MTTVAAASIIAGIAAVVGAIAGLMVVPEVSRCWRSRSSEARSVPVPSKAAAVVADLCAIARPHLADPSWTLHEAAKQGFTDVWWPDPYLSGKEQLERNVARAQLLVQA